MPNVLSRGGFAGSKSTFTGRSIRSSARRATATSSNRKLVVKAEAGTALVVLNEIHSAWIHEVIVAIRVR
eukprot:2760475-Pyramimonas_sp.AAC.2